jgi:hypothetical protein
MKGRGNKLVKFIRAVSVITMIVLVLSVSLVSALEQHEASVTTLMPGDTVVRGETGQLRIVFTSNTDKDLEIYYIGIHVDWMEEDQLFGIDYSSSPKTALSMEDLGIIDIINYTIPDSASLGAHTYYIGIDGYDEDGEAFSWKSDDATIYVTTPVSTTEPTSTPTPTTNSNTTDTLSMVLYGLLVASVAVLVILLVLLMKKRGTKPAAKSDVPPESPKPEEKPDEGQDFSI